ncbi:unnamed protein product [Camellia sinensis]
MRQTPGHMGVIFVDNGTGLFQVGSNAKSMEVESGEDFVRSIQKQRTLNANHLGVFFPLYNID